MKCCRIRFICLLSAFAAGLDCLAAVETVDFTLWSSKDGEELPNGWSESGMEQYASEALVGAAYFNGEGDSVFSRVFPDPILSVTVESATRTPGLTRQVTLTPVVDGRKQSAIALDSPTGAVYVSQKVDLSSLGATKLILSSSVGSGNWAVRKIVVTYGEEEIPEPTVSAVGRISVSGTGADRFELSWEPVDGADGYVVNVWTNESDSVCSDVFQAETRFDCAAEAVVYGYSVIARFTVGGETVDSAAVAGRIDMSAPPWLKCWFLSSFLPRPGFRCADFSGLGRLEKMRDWSNGVDGDSFYAYKDGGPTAVVRPATTNSVYADLYCYNAGTKASPTNGLALLGSSSTGLRLVLPIRLDAERRLDSLAVSYGAREVKRGTADRTVLAFAWATVGDILAMDGGDVAWTEVPEAAFAAAEGLAGCRVDIPVKALGNASFLCLRWSVRKRANSSMIGISDVRVEGRLRDKGLVFVLR